MSVLRVYLLGGLAVTWDETQLPLIPGVLTRSLSGCLVSYRDRSHNRDLLAGTFWPDLPDAVARRRLSQSLWQIRKALSSHPVLVTEADTVQLNPDLPLWVAGEQDAPLLPTATRPMALPLPEQPDRLPLAGRRREMAESLLQLESASRGAGGLTLVYGEARMGKTRLLGELADNAQWRGICTEWERCCEPAAPPAYQPQVEALRAGIATLQTPALELLWRVELSQPLPKLGTACKHAAAGADELIGVL